jgi:uncharacterized protein YqjF (DUF2071 family)
LWPAAWRLRRPRPTLPRMLARVLQRAAGAGDAMLARLSPGSAIAAQRRGLGERDHRPWPLPDRPWVQGQTWIDLLFAHWSLPIDALRPAVPAALPIDTFDDRTYTTIGGRPGIYFLSLDAASALAVAAARATYRLPYHRAHMAIERTGQEIRYRSRRADPAAELIVSYRPDGTVFRAPPGTLEHFLTERYCMYVVDERQRIRRADIHHPPWPLQPAVADIDSNTMAAPHGIELRGEPLLHFTARQDVVIWPLAPAD